MRRLHALAVTTVLAITVVGCSSGDPGAEPTVTTSSGSSTTSTPDPSDDPGETDSPTETEPTETEPTETETALVWQPWAQQIRISDAADRVKQVRKCVSKTPTDAKCAETVQSAGISSQAVALQFGRLGDPPSEIADLQARTLTATQAVYDQAVAYVAACPEAGATSEQCAADLRTYLSDTLEPIEALFAEWKPYVKQIDR